MYRFSTSLRVASMPTATNPAVVFGTTSLMPSRTMSTIGYRRFAQASSTASVGTPYMARRPFSMPSFINKKFPRVELDEALYDRQAVHYSGKILGVKTDRIVYYAKLGGGVFVILMALYYVFKGYSWLTEFSMATVARFGFMSGFATCAVLYSSALLIRRTYQINPNAVYNQSIALVMKHPDIVNLLGTHPKTGEFRAYCATGGFKLPLMRRIRSGSYELADLLALRPRRLQMIFFLKNTINGKEGMVTVDVQKESTGVATSTNTFKSLAVIIGDPTSIGKDEQRTIILIGTEGDMFMKTFARLK